jgi:hypothetical protein
MGEASHARRIGSQTQGFRPHALRTIILPRPHEPLWNDWRARMILIRMKRSITQSGDSYHQKRNAWFFMIDAQVSSPDAALSPVSEPWRDKERLHE